MPWLACTHEDFLAGVLIESLDYWPILAGVAALQGPESNRRTDGLVPAV